MKGKDGRLGFCEKDEKRIWKNHMEEIMNTQNDWNHVTEASMIEGPKNITREEMAIVIKVMKPEKAAGLSEVCAEMISASGEVGVSVMVEHCQRVLYGKECQMNGKQVCWYQFSRERGGKKLQYLQRSRAVRARHEDR